ncbi:hypothetical protein BV378_00600 [Nostoc sp. RF31YmG]|nr:hypothetical protein BV378_00600 [Nostoc sp. RF31YmG]
MREWGECGRGWGEMGQGEKLRAGVPPVEQTSEGQGRWEEIIYEYCLFAQCPIPNAPYPMPNNQ